MTLAELPDVRIGARLRALRHERGLTVTELAEDAGLTAGFISQLERDLTSVSLAKLARICAALDVRIGQVTDEAPGGALLRRDERQRKIFVLRRQEHVLLSGDEPRFHVTESRIGPGGTAGEELYTLPADVELVYVLAGCLELRVGEETFDLEAGDTLTYSPRDPHTWRNPSADAEAVVLWVAVPNPYREGL